MGPREPLPRQTPKQNIRLALPARRYCNPVRSWQDLRGSPGWNHPGHPGPARMERLGPRRRAGAVKGETALDWRNPGAENLILPEVSVSGDISSLWCNTVCDHSSGPEQSRWQVLWRQRLRPILLLSPNYHLVAFCSPSSQRQV